MSLWIDMTDDVSRRYYNAFIRRVDMPEYVKSAQVLDREAADGLPAAAFADQSNRKFALDSKANCWCSALYFYGNQCTSAPASPQAEDRLVKAAKVWGILDDVKAVKQAFEVKEIPVSYALSFDYRGQRIERCPCHTKEAAAASAGWLHQNRYKFPISVQKEAAVRLLKAASDATMDARAKMYLDRLANPQVWFNLNTKVAAAITDRLSVVPMTRWTELEDELLKVAQDLNSRPSEVCRNGDLIASALEAMDVRHKLASKWGASLQHPVDVCFRVSFSKAAAQTEAVVYLTTGTPVDMRSITDHQLEKGLKVAGDDFLSYCQPDGINVDRSKAAEILPTLPKPEAHRFESAVKKAGYRPATSDDLIDDLFKESQDPAISMDHPAIQIPEQPQDDVQKPEPWEDDQSFEARMNQKKEEAKIVTLDANAALAASKARQAKQQLAAAPYGQANAPQPGVPQSAPTQ